MQTETVANASKPAGHRISQLPIGRTHAYELIRQGKVKGAEKRTRHDHRQLERICCRAARAGGEVSPCPGAAQSTARTTKRHVLCSFRTGLWKAKHSVAYRRFSGASG
jgi:hypothetical protein